MLYESSLTAEMIDEVYITGCFGSYMDKESAVRIGLLPEAVRDKLISGGNSAGIGAIKVLLNKQYLSISSGLNEGLLAGMDIIGGKFKRNEVYVPEVLLQ